MSDLRDGYYWYRSVPQDNDPNLEPYDTWTILHVWRGKDVTLMGIEMGWHLSELHGQFIGPLEPPEP